MAALKSTMFLTLSVIIFFGSRTAATCSQPLTSTRTCYRQVSYVVYRAVYSRASRNSYIACGWWGWDRCSRTYYYQRLSRLSEVRYRTEMYCCSGYHSIGGSCEPQCSCEAGYTCVAPNVCRKGVQLMLGGVNYPNNSVIQFDSIYYTPDHCHSLLCTTDRIPCCYYSQSGNWYNVQPNGSFINVPLSTSKNDYYQSRENDGTLRLIQQNGTTQSNNASYCCQLFDATSTMQTLCVTIAQYSPGVWLSLNGQLVPNNSAVELREIYETPDNIHAHTLMCMTPKRPCCRSPPYRFGEWFYPNGSAVPIDGSGNSFFKDRGDDGTVRLHRRGIASISAAMGQYCCEIPNVNDITHRLCTHFIDSSPGVWLISSKYGQVYPNNSVISLSEVFGTRHSLLCVTERRPCCSSSRIAGDWHYHNGTAVSSYGQGFSFYTSRGDDGTVRLHTRDNNVSLMNTSQFCCELLNMNGVSQKLCVYICDSDCEIMTSEQVSLIETTTAMKETLVTRVTSTVTQQIPSTKEIASDSAHIGAIVGYVAMGFAAVLLCIVVIIAIILWKYFSLKVKTTQSITNTKSSKVEIEHTKHNDTSTVKETEIEDGNCGENNMALYEIVKETKAQDDSGDENMYETEAEPVATFSQPLTSQ